MTVGQAVAPNASGNTCDPNEGDLQPSVSGGNSYVVPLTGDITSFATRVFDTASTRATIKFVAWRAASSGAYRIVGISAGHQVPASDPVTPVSTNITAIHVLAGDVIGFWLTGSNGFPHCIKDGTTGDLNLFKTPLTSAAVGDLVSGFDSAVARISVSASLKPKGIVTAQDTTSPDYRMRATLTNSAGTPISGQTITFTTGGMTICSATTNASGVATCFANTQLKDVIGSINETGFTATFAGTGSLVGSSDHGDFGSPTGPPGVKGG